MICYSVKGIPTLALVEGRSIDTRLREMRCPNKLSRMRKRPQIWISPMSSKALPRATHACISQIAVRGFKSFHTKQEITTSAVDHSRRLE